MKRIVVLGLALAAGVFHAVSAAEKFAWRGLMVDEGRFFFGKDAIKETLDRMSASGLNVFHWHLTEDQGWRLEIRKFPELTEIGAVRPHSPKVHTEKDPDGVKYGPYFYTEADVAEVLAYAKARDIRVIPEIEIPGHIRALLAAHPEFSCRGDLPKETPGWFDIMEDVLCAGNDEAIRYVEQVLDEVCRMFPDEVVHIGGDECPKKRWKECPKCQARMKALGLEDERMLQGWVVRHFADYLAKKGRRAMAWDEVIESGMCPTNVLIQCWRDRKHAAKAAKLGHDVVMSPWKETYLSIPESREDPATYRRPADQYDHYVTRERLRKFNPLDEIPAELSRRIIGAECCCWSEGTRDAATLHAKTWPRAAIFAAALCSRPPCEWEDLAVNSLNRLPARTYSMPLADESAALTDALEPETPFKKSLNGTWKFSWAGNPELRVKDFWRADFDDSNWFTIDVPGCVELKGFGSPGYTNIRYPHAEKWPRILDRDTDEPDYNPVSSYRTTFTVPTEWKDRRVILRFDGVYSAYYVWVNGQKVGYAEDSKLPSEFDITVFLREGENLLAVEVYRWCDGSYLEDQDMFRYSGIFRDVTLWSIPKDGVWDFTVRTVLSEDYSTATIAVDGIEGEWSATLYDADRKKVGEVFPSHPSSLIPHPSLWSAEKPYLYTLVLKKGSDIRMKRVGFKEQKIVGHTFLVNGQPVKFKGVNRHECSVKNGRTVSLDEMIADITLMKRYNINTVRTCHYPDHHLWYDLCDRYGIYLVAEANVEGHEPGYGEKSLGLFPEWDHSIVERNERQAVFYRNNPSVTMWSIGNETGHGDCFRHAIAAVKRIDPTRPVHWERGNVDADVDSRMYPPVEWLEQRGKIGDAPASAEKMSDKYGTEFGEQSSGKCFFLCEYAHAMGNAIGNFQEYWDVFYRYESLSGGCIWDWIDQAIWKEPEHVLAYGGDFDEEPNDGPFCVNGVIGPFREVSAKLVEVGHVHRNLVVTRSADEGDNGFATVFELWNRFAFTSADEFLGVWSLRENGVVTKRGAFVPPALKPLGRCRFTVPGVAEALAASAPGAELFVDFEFRTKTDAPWAGKGWVVARDQVALGKEWKFSLSTSGQETASPLFAQDEKTVTVTAGPTKAVFCRKSGTLCELVMDGRTILRDPKPGVAAGPLFTCMRAFTDNDSWVRNGDAWGENRKKGGFYSRGLSQLRHHARPIIVDGNSLKIVTEVTGSKSAGFTQESVWTFSTDGAVTVATTVTPHGTMPLALPRLGFSLKLDKSLERMRYYGRGPCENYIDRLTGSFLGVWESTVTDQFEPYVRPQDNGYKCDVRWAEFTDKAGKGVRFSASEPLFMQALHYDVEDLEFARHRNGQKRFRTPLVPRPEVCLNLDVRQLGLGGASCGPETMAKYRFPIEPVSWTLRFEPVR